MTVQVIIPWRSGCPYREAALGKVIHWWQKNHPDWPVTIADFPIRFGEWRKGMALALVGNVDPRSVVIVSDADVICKEVDIAVQAVDPTNPESQFAWAMPHRDVQRLNELATSRAIYDGWWPLQDWSRRELREHVERMYPGFPGGGMVVMTGHVFNTIPIDPRFAGWGQEDHSWSRALHMLAGAPMRGHGILWHLWHPKEPRIKPGIGSEHGLRLWNEYRSAATPEAMRSMIRTARAEAAMIAGRMLR
jgi:hypothetical protein